MANADDDPIIYLNQVEYAARRLHDIYYGRLAERHTLMGNIHWDDEPMEGHREALLYAVDMLVQEGTMKFAD